jgi:hypothetical protein
MMCGSFCKNKMKSRRTQLWLRQGQALLRIDFDIYYLFISLWNHNTFSLLKQKLHSRWRSCKRDFFWIIFSALWYITEKYILVIISRKLNNHKYIMCTTFTRVCPTTPSPFPDSSSTIDRPRHWIWRPSCTSYRYLPPARAINSNTRESIWRSQCCVPWHEI